MASLAAVCTVFCLVFVTSAAVPHRPFWNNRLKRTAVKALAWAQERGGVIFNEILLGKRSEHGRILYDPKIQEDFRDFLRELSSQVNTLQRQAQAAGSTIGRRQDAHQDLQQQQQQQHNRHHLEAQGRYTDFNDILVILGDYTKSFRRLNFDRPRDGQSVVHRRDSDQGQTRSNPHEYRGLILPPGTDLFRLGFNDILDILGDYLKSFSDFFAPYMLQFVTRREERSIAEEISAAMEQVLSTIAQIKSMSVH